MGDAAGRLPDSVRLLVAGGGKWDPEVVRLKRLVKRWQREAEVYDIADAHWESLPGTSGKQGAISLMRHTLERAGVTCHSWEHCEAGGHKIDVLHDADAPAVLERRLSRRGGAASSRRCCKASTTAGARN